MTVRRDRVNWLRILLLTGALLPWTAVEATAEQHYFRRYAGADGLSQAVVQAIYQDRAGYLWIGTQAGLNRYNGLRFTIYSIQQGLAHDWINAIAEDARGRIWLATLGGVSCREGGRFLNYSTANGLVDNRVVTLAVDRQDRIWCATPQGVSCYDGQAWRTFTVADGLPAATVNALLVDHTGRLWAGTAAGLAYFSDNRFISYDPEGLQGKEVRAIIQDRQNRLWVGLVDSVRVIPFGEIPNSKHQIPKGNSQSQAPNPLRGNSQSQAPNPKHLEFGIWGLELPSKRVTALCVDHHGIVWIGTSQGLGSVRDDRITFLTAANGLPHADVRSLFVDREGLLWIGTFGGLYKFQGRAFTNYTMVDGLGSNSVRPIVRSWGGFLWVGTTGGLSRFDGQTWRTYTVKDGLVDNVIAALHEDSQGWLWIGTLAGLNIFDGARFLKDPSLPPSGPVVAITEDRAGTIWCAVQGGTALFKRVSDRFEPVGVPGQTFSNARLLVDHKGRLWASGDNGLSRWDGQSWRTYTTKDGLAANQPYFLCEDRAGRIWFGYHSSHGLTSFDGDRFQHYTSAHGLTNNAVYSLGLDRQGHLWIGTARGVDRFDGQAFINYGTEEGYADNESNAGGFWADPDGTLWFGTMGGLSHYDPRFDLTNSDAPLVELTQLRLGNRHFAAGLSPTVEPEENNLLARVEALSFVNEKRLSFEYRLVGFQDHWSPLERQEVYITNLPPGRYALEARARKYQGPWSQTAQFSFVIAAPFWQTWWFWFIAVNLIASAVYGGHWLQTARVRRRAQELEQKVTERTSELAQKTEELESFLYTVSHDLKAPVISLQGMAGLLRLELGSTLSENAALYLERIHANSVHMQRLINELLELSRVGRLTEPKVAVKMNDLIEDVLEELQGQITLKQATITVADYLPMVVCERNRIRQVWMNLIANALHYSRPETPPHIKIGAGKGKNGHGTFFVADNGIGIAREYQERVFDIFYRVDGKYQGSESTGVGLAIVKRIVESHGGKVWVESEGRDRGSTFWFTLPKNLRGFSHEWHE